MEIMGCCKIFAAVSYVWNRFNVGILYVCLGEYMAKTKNTTVFFCQNCGHESSKWLGQCPGCRQWNTFVEEKAVTGSQGKSAKSHMGEKNIPAALSEISLEEEDRMGTGMQELDRVLERDARRYDGGFALF